MNRSLINSAFTYSLAFVWIINGLFCKIMNLVPRHKQIVSRILGREYADELTIAIGFLEVLMAVWIISGYKRRLCATAQIVAVVIMNSIEFILASDLLLWGKLNALFAFFFILVIALHELYYTN
jgi:uncharacterized membrane protein YphA (DoxX/SURF4 family)